MKRRRADILGAQGENVTSPRRAFDGKVCDYCGARRDVVRFYIGAGPADGEWTLHEGTGKLSCGACHTLGVNEAQAVIASLTK